jgi:hypothetical protein
MLEEASNASLQTIREKLHQINDKYYFLQQDLKGLDRDLEEEVEEDGEE